VTRQRRSHGIAPEDALSVASGAGSCVDIDTCSVEKHGWIGCLAGIA